MARDLDQLLLLSMLNAAELLLKCIKIFICWTKMLCYALYILCFARIEIHLKQHKTVIFNTHTETKEPGSPTTYISYFYSVSRCNPLKNVEIPKASGTANLGVHGSFQIGSCFVLLTSVFRIRVHPYSNRHLDPYSIYGSGSSRWI